MTDLLSKGEYAALAAVIKFYVEPFIVGKLQKSGAAKTMKIINPATGKVQAGAGNAIASGDGLFIEPALPC